MHNSILCYLQKRSTGQTQKVSQIKKFPKTGLSSMNWECHFRDLTFKRLGWYFDFSPWLMENVQYG